MRSEAVMCFDCGKMYSGKLKPEFTCECGTTWCVEMDYIEEDGEIFHTPILYRQTELFAGEGAEDDPEDTD